MALLFCCRATSCLSAAFFPRSEDAVRFRHAPAGFRSRARPRLRPPRASERRAAASGIGGEAVAPSDAIANAFRQVDADKSGFLTATELKTALEIVKVDQVPDRTDLLCPALSIFTFTLPTHTAQHALRSAYPCGS
eukprot:3154970-Pleurochrysis_carterae.AAC.1